MFDTFIVYIYVFMLDSHVHVNTHKHTIFMYISDKMDKITAQTQRFIEDKLYKMFSKSVSRYHKPCNYCMFYFVANMFCVLAGAIFTFFHDYLIETGTIVYSLYGQ